MKMLKILLAVGALALSISPRASAQVQPQPQWKTLPLLSGYNVLVPTNATIGLGTTNVVFSRTDGKIVYSLTNREGALWGDAFQAARLKSDVNGNLPANAAVFYMVGNTNLIPIAVTNGAGGNVVTNWALAYPYPSSTIQGATTNIYAFLPGGVNSTNVYTISLYRRTVINPQKASSDTTTAPVPVYQAETTSSFVFTVTGNGATPVAGYTNLPSGFLQAGQSVYATVTCGALLNAAPDGLLNALDIIQPQN